MGPVIVYAYLQSVGVVDDHLVGCFRRSCGVIPGPSAPLGWSRSRARRCLRAWAQCGEPMGKKAKHKGRKKDRRESAGRGREAVRSVVRGLASRRSSGWTPPTPGSPLRGAALVEPRRSSQRNARVRLGVDAAPARRVRRGRAGRTGWPALGTVLQRQLGRADAGEGLTRARLSALALLVLGRPAVASVSWRPQSGVRPPTMTRLVHAMEADGWVVREPDPADRRSIIIRATPAGEAQLETGRSLQLAPLAASIAAPRGLERRTLEDGTDLLERLLRDRAGAERPSA